MSIYTKCQLWNTNMMFTFSNWLNQNKTVNRPLCLHLCMYMCWHNSLFIQAIQQQSRCQQNDTARTLLRLYKRVTFSGMLMPNLIPFTINYPLCGSNTKLISYVMQYSCSRTRSLNIISVESTMSLIRKHLIYNAWLKFTLPIEGLNIKLNLSKFTFLNENAISLQKKTAEKKQNRITITAEYCVKIVDEIDALHASRAH